MDIEYLFKLRLVVGRVGEMDLAAWWNTNGQLGSLGASVLRRGFPRTFRFAMARSVFAVAAARCEGLYRPQGAVTLWNLPAATEDEVDQRWESWIDAASEWEPFFLELEHLTADLGLSLLRLGLIQPADLEQVAKLRRSAEQRAVLVPGTFTHSNDDLEMLALAFSRGDQGNPTVPYQAWGGEP